MNAPTRWRKRIAESLLRRLGSVYPALKFAPPGHFYSPLPDPQIFGDPANPMFDVGRRELPGIDLRAAEQLALLEQLRRDLAAFPYPAAVPDRRFHLQQNFFGPGDARILLALLRHLRPARIIEVGSGFSSALMLDAADTTPDWRPRLTFIEPYPQRLRALLRGDDAARVTILERPAQAVPLATYGELVAGDLLFIDSSHVAKIGSDVNFLYFEVLPRLAPGVIVHVHDVIWPFEYPPSWLAEGRAWNEAYLVRALLIGSQRFAIALWSSYLAAAHAERIADIAPPLLQNSGGSLYLRVQ